MPRRNHGVRIPALCDKLAFNLDTGATRSAPKKVASNAMREPAHRRLPRRG
jgi:hypothetical protein